MLQDQFEKLSQLRGFGGPRISPPQRRALPCLQRSRRFVLCRVLGAVCPQADFLPVSLLCVCASDNPTVHVLSMRTPSTVTEQLAGF